MKDIDLVEQWETELKEHGFVYLNEEQCELFKRMTYLGLYIEFGNGVYKCHLI